MGVPVVGFPTGLSLVEFISWKIGQDDKTMAWKQSQLISVFNEHINTGKPMIFAKQVVSMSHFALIFKPK